MGISTSAALAARPELAHYAIARDPDGGWCGHVAIGGQRITLHLASKAAVLRDIKATWPRCKEVPLAFLGIATLAPFAIDVPAKPAAPELTDTDRAFAATIAADRVARKADFDARTAEIDPFADVRAAGHVWGKIDATNGRADDSHKAYCWRFPAEACSTTPPPGHADAFRDAYDDAYAAEMRGRRGAL
jgi:hypothetical protein